MLQDKVKM